MARVSGRCVASPREGWATQRTTTQLRILAARYVRVFQSNHPHRKTEGAGKAGCRSHPWSACSKKARGRTTGTSRTTGLPCAMVLRLIRDLPGDRALLPPSSADRSADLTPALGRQDHTISPSAICCSSRNTSRPSHPAPNVRDDREAPLMWVRDAREHGFDLPDGASENCTTGNSRMQSMQRPVITSEAKQSRPFPQRQSGLLCRVAPRNDNSHCELSKSHLLSSLRTQGPITTGWNLWHDGGTALFSNNRYHAVWVPACAGTTGRESARSRNPIRLTEAAAHERCPR
jgi:hypothetical protein